MESVPEMMGSIMVLDRVESDNGSFGNGCRDEEKSLKRTGRDSHGRSRAYIEERRN